MKDPRNSLPDRDDILHETAHVFCLTIENVFRTLLGKDIFVNALPDKIITGEEWHRLLAEPMLMLSADAKDGFESPLSLFVSSRDAVRITDLILVDFHREDEVCRETDVETLKVYADQIFDYLAVELGTYFQTPFAFDTARALMVEAGILPTLPWRSEETLRIRGFDVRIGEDPPMKLTFILGLKDMDRLVSAKLRILEKSLRSNMSEPTSSRDELRPLERLMDIPVTLTVEIGQKYFPIRDILSLAEGTVLELDRSSADPADILINNVLVARGEIVVVNDRIGIRLTEVMGPRERLESLGES